MIAPTIQNIEDGEATTPDDVFEVMRSGCINCHKAYDDHFLVMFVRVKKNRLIWWHIEHCTAVKRPYKQKGYVAPNIEELRKEIPEPRPAPKHDPSGNRRNYYNT